MMIITLPASIFFFAKYLGAYYVAQSVCHGNELSEWVWIYFDKGAIVGSPDSAVFTSLFSALFFALLIMITVVGAMIYGIG